MTQKRIIVIGGAGPVTAAMMAQLMQHEHPEIHFLAMSEEDLLRKAEQENPFRDPPDDVKEVLARLERKMPPTPTPATPPAPHPEPQYVKANKKRPKPKVPKPRDQATRGRHQSWKCRRPNNKGRRR